MSIRAWLLFPGLLAACAPRHEPPPLRDFKGAIHVHSKYSHDSDGTYEEILAAAKKVGLDFIVMTDHPPKDDPGLPLREGRRGLHDGVLFIQGAELSNNILAVGIREPVTAHGPQAKIDEIHRQGGLAFVCHGEEVDDWSFTGFDGMEIYNIHTAFKAKMKDPKWIARALKLFKEDPDAAWLELCEPQEVLLRKWDELSRTRRVTGIAGNDAHQNTTVLGMRLDPYWRSLGFVSTHVLAPELAETAILDGLRLGCAYVAFEAVDDPRRFVSGMPFGGREAYQLDHMIKRHSDLRWFSNGKPAGYKILRDIVINQLGSDTLIPEQGTTHRLEIWRDAGGKMRPWILASPIYTGE